MRRGRTGGRRSGRGHGMRGTGSFVSKDDRRAATDRTGLSVSGSYGRQGFLYLPQEAAVSVQMRSTGSEKLPAAIEESDDKIPSLPSFQAGTDRGREVTAEWDELVVRLNEHICRKRAWKGGCPSKMLLLRSWRGQ